MLDDLPPDQSRDRAVEAVRALARASSVLERVSGEVSLAHYRVLAAIASGDERASRIARKLAVGKPTVSAAVEALGQRGLLERRSSVEDQRAADLHLTEDGAALLDRVETAMVARLDDLAARTPDAAVLIEALTWLGAALDARLAARDPAPVPVGVAARDPAPVPVGVAARDPAPVPVGVAARDPAPVPVGVVARVPAPVPVGVADREGRL